MTEVVTADAAAQHLEVSVAEIEAMIAAGELRGADGGVDRASIDELVASVALVALLEDDESLAAEDLAGMSYAEITPDWHAKRPFESIRSRFAFAKGDSSCGDPHFHASRRHGVKVQAARVRSRGRRMGAARSGARSRGHRLRRARSRSAAGGDGPGEPGPGSGRRLRRGFRWLPWRWWS